MRKQGETRGERPSFHYQRNAGNVDGARVKVRVTTARARSPSIPLRKSNAVHLSYRHILIGP
ncbi:hypothetical protein SLEP1_g283 [Rubroshorea leprosula]|uniref:Uncharacterized protein n=1 Tax=Rubroshorea leprosula TaxID=152421 RepID=A0AAV5HIT2_9ROSI|nr:hypothetical protein SLEP1_g283 [Rubroshorea leprosula]